MKNLSKVLAVVLAFMLVFATVSAANFTDVTADARYGEAVSVLSSLNILKGYEDGSFKPEGNITRAEFAAVVCRLLGLEETANGAKGQQVFDDVPGDHWASGYVALASQQGIVNGYGDGKFGPEDNVLYEQAIKMIVAALGYTPMAEVNGGYPGGFQIVAAQRGILAGVNGGATGVAATRAIVAQMSYNALEVPIMGQTSFGTDIKFTATDELLLNKLEVTKLEGTIEQTPSSDKSVKEGKVQVKYERQITAVKENYTAQRYYMGDAEYYANPSDVYGTLDNQRRYKKATINVADDIKADVEKYLDYNVVMYVDDATDSNATLLAVFPKASKNSDISFKSKDVDMSKTRLSDTGYAIEGTAAVYTDKDADKTEKYDVSITKVYVNGRQQTSVAIPGLSAGSDIRTTNDMLNVINYYYDDDKDVDFKLVCNTSGDEYNIVYITAYEDIVVETINSKATTVTAKTPSLGGISRVKFDEDEYAGRYTILKDGAEVSFDEIKEDDVLSIAGYVNPSSKELEYGTVIITTERASGKVSTYDRDDKTITVGGKVYDYNATIGGMIGHSGANGISLGDEVVLYINAAGYVIDVDKTASNTNLKYGFATKVVKTTGVEDAWQIRILTTDGTWTTYDLASKVAFDGNTAVTTSTITAATMATNLNGTLSGSRVLANKMIAYETNASNEVNKIYVVASTNVDETFNYATANADYIASTDGIGGIYLDDNTAIFSVATSANLNDTIDEDDVTVAKKDALVDRTNYNVTGYGVDDDGYVKALYGIGVVGEIDLAADFFVISSVANTTNEDGDEGYLLTGYVAGETVEVFADKTETTVTGAGYNGTTVDIAATALSAASLAKGDVILYSKKANGEADKIVRLIANSAVKTMLDSLNTVGSATYGGVSGIKLATVNQSGDTYTFYFGFAYDRTGSRIEIAQNVNGTGAMALSGQSAIGASVDNFASKLKVIDATVGEIDTDKTGDGNGDLVFIRTKYETNIEDFVIYDYRD